MQHERENVFICIHHISIDPSALWDTSNTYALWGIIFFLCEPMCHPWVSSLPTHSHRPQCILGHMQYRCIMGMCHPFQHIPTDPNASWDTSNTDTLWGIIFFLC